MPCSAKATTRLAKRPAGPECGAAGDESMMTKERAFSREQSGRAPVGALSGRKVRAHDYLGIAQTEGVGGNANPAGVVWGKATVIAIIGWQLLGLVR